MLSRNFGFQYIPFVIGTVVEPNGLWRTDLSSLMLAALYGWPGGDFRQALAMLTGRGAVMRLVSEDYLSKQTDGA